MLLNQEMKNRYGLDEKTIVSAGTLPDLDEAYSRLVVGTNCGIGGWRCVGVWARAL